MIPLDLQLFPRYLTGRFLSRPNRFLLRVRLGDRTVRAYLPNPGRMGELLLPEVEVWLVPGDANRTRRTAYTVVAVEGPSGPVFLHTGRTNDIAQALLEQGLVPGMEEMTIERREVPLGRSRFDFLLRDSEDNPCWLEVKSCTLQAGRLALFPDAVTARGRRHLEELGELARTGQRTAVLFVVSLPEARFFLPDWHTDLAFTRSFLEHAPRMMVRAMVVALSRELQLRVRPEPLEIPLAVLAAEARDRGAYLLLLRLRRRSRLSIGALGSHTFPAGLYGYVGSALKGLDARVARHRRHRKKLHWHVDHLRARADVEESWCIRSSRRDECNLARALGEFGDFFPARFGSSDCSCPGHLIRFDGDPRHRREFHELLGSFRSRAVEG